MDTLPMTERGQPPFDPDEETLIRAAGRIVKEQIVCHFESEVINTSPVARLPFLWRSRVERKNEAI